jgi:hypothetical protein
MFEMVVVFLVHAGCETWLKAALKMKIWYLRYHLQRWIETYCGLA